MAVPLIALDALDATGYSVIVPVALAIADATDTGPATVGLLVASFPTGMVAGFALAGAVVRRRGARTPLVGSLALVDLGALDFVLGDSLATYFASRLLMGLRVRRHLDRSHIRHPRALAQPGERPRHFSPPKRQGGRRRCGHLRSCIGVGWSFQLVQDGP